MKSLHALLVTVCLSGVVFAQEEQVEPLAETPEAPQVAEEASAEPVAEESGSERGERTGIRVNVGASNLFQFARGEQLPELGIDTDPWSYDYLTNSTDFRIDVGSFWFKGRFSVNEPSRGISNSQDYSEGLNRRAIGLTMRNFSISTGHINTSFARGLALNLREDRTVDTANILDGVHGLLETEFVTVEALAGRPVAGDAGLLGTTGSERRDGAFGAYAQGFPLARSELLSGFSGSAVGAGLVNYRQKVGPHGVVPTIDSITVIDSALGIYDTTKSYVEWQDRTDHYVPVFTLSVPAPWFDLYVEHTRLISQYYHYDSLTYLREERRLPTNYATYLSAGGSFAGFSLLAEYKDYNYTNMGAQTMSYYADPPTARYKHGAQLLTKHEPANLTGGVRGYNLMVTWSKFDNTTIMFDFCSGGPRNPDNVFLFDQYKASYWEYNLEWTQTFSDLIQTKLFAHYGATKEQLPTPDARALIGTAKLTVGPIAGRHTFTLLGEFGMQGTSYPVYDTLTYEIINEEEVWAKNSVVTLAYSLSPWVVIAGSWEHAQKAVSLDEPVESANYLSAGLTVRPTDRHSILVEYGSFSGGQKCTMGNCFTLPAFKGLRMTVTSLL